MDYKLLGRTGIKLPAIGFGTWGIGGEMQADSTHDKKAIMAIRKAIELGMSLIDTGELYGDGHCEEVIGEAIKPVPREKIFIISKVWRTHMQHDALIKAAENSLKRLNSEWIDLYLAHFPNPEVPLSETVPAMEELVERELVKFIGFSNFNISQLEEAKKYLKRTEIVSIQSDYSLFIRGRENDLIPYCQKNQITMTAFRPLFRPAVDGGLPHDEFLNRIGQKYGKTAAQVALNWVISQEPVIAIPKTLNLKHLEENAAATGWVLTPEDKESISVNFSKYLSEWGVPRKT
jgi:diketogulonate reductase-like aldo/keto reductase